MMKVHVVNCCYSKMAVIRCKLVGNLLYTGAVVSTYCTLNKTKQNYKMRRHHVFLNDSFYSRSGTKGRANRIAQDIN